jgi:3-phenylpropionate/trans-cinnamate dioxygenase ferredoxin subunit
MSTEERRFVPVCAVTDIPNGKHKAFEVEGVSVLVVNLNREFHAVHNRCTHLDFPLEGGRQMGWELMCRQHGARFDIRSGRALGGPAVNPIPVYKTRVVGDIVEVALP